MQEMVLSSHRGASKERRPVPVGYPGPSRSAKQVRWRGKVLPGVSRIWAEDGASGLSSLVVRSRPRRVSCSSEERDQKCVRSCSHRCTAIMRDPANPSSRSRSATAGRSSSGQGREYGEPRDDPRAKTEEGAHRDLSDPGRDENSRRGSPEGLLSSDSSERKRTVSDRRAGTGKTAQAACTSVAERVPFPWKKGKVRSLPPVPGQFSGDFGPSFLDLDRSVNVRSPSRVA